MGIRFLCPNGHKLNVKAHLAGKRGICPQCDAKFLVPRSSGGQANRVEDDALESAAPSAAPAATAPPAPPPTPPPALAPPAATSDAAPDALPEVWYLCTPNGEQFGPTSSEAMGLWIAEGRVTVDCWVWKTGWPEWKTGGQAITWLNITPPPITPPERAITEPTGTEPTGLPPAAQLPAATTPSTAYQSSQKIRKARIRRITFFLSAVVLLLIVLLVVVLTKN